MYPPQARGWTLCSGFAILGVYVSPAGAGMDRSTRICATYLCCIPRRRGDGPFTGNTSVNGEWYPPQARGWTSNVRTVRTFRTVSPAGAGMDPRDLGGQRGPHRIPRRRGDGPVSDAAPNASIPYPPQARGWTRRAGIRTSQQGVSPAGAGMDPGCSRQQRMRFRIPRRRGDGPSGACMGAGHPRYPPQARGWTSPIQYQGLDQRVSPAGAGMDPGRGVRTRVPIGIPRRRGDGPFPYEAVALVMRYPPQARGWTYCRGLCYELRHVSPAGAGMDLRTSLLAGTFRCIPRRRGDGPDSARLLYLCDTYPPQARGWTLRNRIYSFRVAVSPAGAGMDPDRPRMARPRIGIPRRRGDGPCSQCELLFAVSYPPQARGWTHPRQRPWWRLHVSPAGAGMDLARGAGARPSRGIPRRRGDGPYVHSLITRRQLYPPQARG